MTCEFAVDDGAYVLGALAPAERAAFERHLGGCAPCRESVASLAVLPGLLRRLDSATAVAVSRGSGRCGLASPPAPCARRSGVEPRARASPAPVVGRRRGLGGRLSGRAGRRRRALFRGRPARCGNVGDAAGRRAGASDRRDRPRHGRGRHPDRDDLSLRERVRRRVDPATRRVPADGRSAEQISTWTARSGQDIAVEAMTHLAADEIGRVELRRADDRTLLTWSPP